MHRQLLSSAFSAALAVMTASPASPALSQVKASVPAEKPLLDVKADAKTGKIILTLPKPDADGVSGRYIYLTQLETGLGSAPIGLDRAAPSTSRILVFHRIGKKVAAEIENPKFVALTGGQAEQKDVRDAFATSIIWLGDVVDTKPDGSFTVDLASFLARDDFDVTRAVKQGGGGEFKFVPELSAADPGFVKIFPRNAEFAAKLTFASDQPKDEVTNIVPDSRTFTLTLRHSLIQLPDSGYVVRHDPYGYAFGDQKVDFSAPLGAPLVRDVATRFRLEKIDPLAARSRVKKPIVFYIDRGAPEPIRTALQQGVGWWNAAFDEAGFVDAFRAEILPEGADPLDVRYNVVNWVNRATRGWSYGSPINDPRTGEIIKGSVLLGSLRARQDMIIFQALVGAGLTGTGDPNDPITATLARIRQLGAHEVGHALGLQHNFAASTQGRYSVMDYPAPRVTLVNGAPSLADAYGAGVGVWDKWVIKWLYGARTDVDAAPLVAQARAAGLRFVADQDARPVSSGQPLGALWDDGADPISELQRMAEVRRVAIERFGAGALPVGEQLADLRRAFVPIWLLDRYQIEAAAKSLGGVDFPYSVNGEGATARTVPGPAQWAALYALLDTMSPARLTVPEHLQPLLSGAAGGSSDRQFDIEIIPTAGGPVFDPLKATEVGAMQTLNALLAAERLNRLEAQHSADGSVPAPAQLFDLLLSRTLAEAGSDVGRRIATTSVLALARAQRDAALSPTIAFQLAGRLDRLADELLRSKGPNQDWARGLAALLKDRQALDKALDDPARVPLVPPGMPIGMDEGL
jgi:hypothetical protein